LNLKLFLTGNGAASSESRIVVERLFGVKVSLNLPQLAGATALVALLADTQQ
jgi:hypothetical protein